MNYQHRPEHGLRMCLWWGQIAIIARHWSTASTLDNFQKSANSHQWPHNLYVKMHQMTPLKQHTPWNRNTRQRQKPRYLIIQYVGSQVFLNGEQIGNIWLNYEYAKMVWKFITLPCIFNSINVKCQVLYLQNIIYNCVIFNVVCVAILGSQMQFFIQSSFCCIQNWIQKLENKTWLMIA